MSERKFCWQRDYLRNPTPCFKQAGNRPCEAVDCLIDERVQELQVKGVFVNHDLIQLFAHSCCRLSSLSRDKHEFRERLVSNRPSFPRLQ